MNDYGALMDGAPGEQRETTGLVSARLTALDVVLLAGLSLLAFQMLGPVLSIPLHLPLSTTTRGGTRCSTTGRSTPAPARSTRRPDAFVFNNYPPLGFIHRGRARQIRLWGHDPGGAGRGHWWPWWGTAALTGLCVTCLGGTRQYGPPWSAALILLIFVNSYFKVYVAVDDPQWLAHAVMLCGLAVLLGRGGISAGTVPGDRAASQADRGCGHADGGWRRS